MMMPKPSLFAEEERGDRRSKLGDPLVGLSKHVDFAALADEIDTALPRPSRAKGGRPPYPTVLMTKILILQQLYNLADDARSERAPRSCPRAREPCSGFRSVVAGHLCACRRAYPYRTRSLWAVCRIGRPETKFRRFVILD